MLCYVFRTLDALEQVFAPTLSDSASRYATKFRSTIIGLKLVFRWELAHGVEPSL